MQILADSMIKKLMDEGKITVDPKPGEKQMQPASIDLTLDSIYRLMGDGGVIDPMDPGSFHYDEVHPTMGSWTLKPGDLHFFKTAETVGFGGKAVKSYIAPRSSMARSMVETVPMSGEVPHWMSEPSRDKIFGTLMSHSFRVSLKKGDRIASAVFFAEGGEERKRDLTADYFETPKDKVGVIDLDKLAKMKPFKPEHSRMIVVDKGKTAKVTTMESFDYSNGKTAGIVSFRGGGVLTNYGNMANYMMGLANTPNGTTPLSTGWAPLVDPGYVGKLSGFLAYYGMPKMLKSGDKVMTITEYGMKGKVERLYGGKNLGSHYQTKK